VWKDYTESRSVRAVNIEADKVSVLFTYGTGSVQWENTYRMNRDGVVHVTASFTPLAELLPDPLRLGLRFDSAPALDSMSWYGRGPQESYADRKTGFQIGRYTGKLADQYHGYIRPQESGNKTDVRWVSLHDADGRGVKVTGGVPLSVNALAFPYEDLYVRAQGKWKSSEIAPHGDGTLLVDLAQAGVGGDTGWDKRALAHMKYRIRVAPAAYSFTISPTTAR
jgi:beta-galactosidase